MFILKQAPHPNAAKLWVDFVLSERGQNVLVQGEALISGRAGFRSPLPDYAPALDSLNVIKIDYEKISKVELQKMREEWVSIFNP
jgi:iron(III) transport system substrate-binding protein